MILTFEIDFLLPRTRIGVEDTLSVRIYYQVCPGVGDSYSASLRQLDVGHSYMIGFGHTFWSNVPVVRRFLLLSNLADFCLIHKGKL